MRPPRLALIADRFTDEACAARAVAAAAAGVPWVHLRDHAAEDPSFAASARACAGPLRDALPGDGRLAVNSCLRVARRLGTDFHAGRGGASCAQARRRLGRRSLVGASVHDASEAAATRRAADYFFFSPVFPTASKPGHPGTGLEALRRFCEAFPDLPVLALGGITPARVGPCLEAGAHGVAVLSGILHAANPARATNRYLDALPAEHPDA